jgi:hypothetical protein
MDPRSFAHWLGVSREKRTPRGAFEAIDALDDYVQAAKRVPLSDQVRVDRRQVFLLLDEIRASIPEEIALARVMAADNPGALERATAELDRRRAERSGTTRAQQ